MGSYWGGLVHRPDVGLREGIFLTARRLHRVSQDIFLNVGPKTRQEDEGDLEHLSLMRVNVGDKQCKERSLCCSETKQAASRAVRRRDRSCSRSPPEIYEESIYYSAAMSHGTACRGAAAVQRQSKRCAAVAPGGDQAAAA